MRKLTSSALAVAVALSLAGCPRRTTATAAIVDNQAQQACDTLAAGTPKSHTVAKRLTLADKVNRWSSRSDNPAIVKQGSTVGRAANHSNHAWRLATTNFLKTCRRAGWEARSARGARGGAG
jgi:hypothetical protein